MSAQVGSNATDHQSPDQYDDEIDLFGTFVCIYLKKKFPKLDSICWVRKIKEDFPKYIENKK